MPVDRFDTPGELRDFPEGSDFYDKWHKRIQGMIEQGPFPGSDGPVPSPSGVPVGEFYNRTFTPVNRVGDRSLVWMGFPRPLLIKHRDEREKAFEKSDDRGLTPDGRRTQQEYLEWRATPGDKPGEIKKVTFTTETPEYWQEMFLFDRNRVLGLYQSLVSTSVRMEELLVGDRYNPVNRWNTSDGIVHYIVTDLPNTLEAAVRLARGSVRFAGVRHVRDNYELSSDAFTSADPRVGFDVNTLARKGLSVTCREAIGLYMTAWDDTGWTKPDGSPVGDYWTVVRGKRGAALRLEYEVPSTERAIVDGVSRPFIVSDISIGGRRITHGGHLAEHITVMIGGTAGLHPA
jgi:hypothetical protein